MNSRKSRRKLKIALIYPGYPPEEELGGGISIFAKHAAEGLVKKGHKVTVISRSLRSSMQQSIHNGIKIIRVPSSSRFSGFFSALNFNNYGSLFYYWKVKKVVDCIEKEKGPFDIIECGDWGAEGFLFSFTSPEKLIIRCHTPSFIAEDWNSLNPPYFSAFLKFLEKITLKRARNITTPSKSLLRAIEKKIKIRPVVVQPYPIKTKAPFKESYPNTYSEKRPLRILVAGRLEQRKGQDIVCRALNILISKHFPVHLVFAGADTPTRTGTFGAYLKSILSKEARNRVDFLGHINYREIPVFYTKFDCYVMSSRFESLGFVVLEAMRAGLCIVASNVCEMPRIIQSCENGLLFQSGNYKDLSSQIEFLLKRPDELERMGRAGRKSFLDRCSKEKPIERMIENYYQILEKNIG